MVCSHCLFFFLISLLLRGCFIFSIMDIFPVETQLGPKIPVAESSQVCYTLLACGDSSRNRLICAFDGAIVVDCVDVQSITTYTASLICTLCAQTDRIAES